MAIRQFAKMGQKAKEDLVLRLTKLGEDAMRYAFDRGYASKTRSRGSKKFQTGDTQAWTDVSGALRDSFASAVFVNGVLRKESVKYIENAPTSKWGRRFVDDYLNRVHPYKNGIGVIVIAAMPYTKYLEQGTHRGGYKIKVVSAARDYIDRNYWAYVYDVYKRFEIGKAKVRIIKGDIDPYYHAFE